MGIETAIIAGLGVASAIGNFNQSKSQARQAAHTGAIEAENRADEIRSLAARQRVSYLQAGLDLEGTPMAVINDTYNTGINDVNAITGGYNRQAKNIMRQARAQLLGNLALTGVGVMASGGGLFNSGVVEGGGGTISTTVNGVYKGTTGWSS